MATRMLRTRAVGNAAAKTGSICERALSGYIRAMARCWSSRFSPTTSSFRWHDGELDYKTSRSSTSPTSRGNNPARRRDRVRVAPSARHLRELLGAATFPAEHRRQLLEDRGAIDPDIRRPCDDDRRRLRNAMRIAACPGRAAIAVAMDLRPLASHPSPSSARGPRGPPPPPAPRARRALASCPASCVCRSLTSRRRSRASVCPRSIAAGSSAGSTDRSRTLAATVSRSP